MDLSVSIPDDLAQRLSRAGEDLSRRALEAFAVEEFRAGRLSQPELRQLLGFATRGALDGFLKARGVYEAVDLDQDRRDLAGLGF